MAEASRDDSIALRIRFKCETLDRFIEKYAADLSPEGFFVRTREPLQVGTVLAFDFCLRDGSSLLSGKGKVSYARHPEAAGTRAPGMGVVFDRLTPASQEVLARILDEKVRRKNGAPVARATPADPVTVRTAVPSEQAAFSDPSVPVEPWMIDKEKTEVARMPPSFYFDEADRSAQVESAPVSAEITDDETTKPRALTPEAPIARARPDRGVGPGARRSRAKTPAPGSLAAALRPRPQAPVTPPPRRLTTPDEGVPTGVRKSPPQMPVQSDPGRSPRLTVLGAAVALPPPPTTAPLRAGHGQGSPSGIRLPPPTARTSSSLEMDRFDLAIATDHAASSVVAARPARSSSRERRRQGRRLAVIGLGTAAVVATAGIWAMQSAVDNPKGTEADISALSLGSAELPPSGNGLPEPEPLQTGEPARGASPKPEGSQPIAAARVADLAPETALVQKSEPARVQEDGSGLLASVRVVARPSRPAGRASSETMAVDEAQESGLRAAPKPSPAAEGRPASAGEAGEEVYWLSVRSSPTGADVLIDGQVEGKTPFQRRIFDASRPYALAIRKAGFELHERTVSASDNWAKKGGVRTLLVSARLERARGGAPQEAEGQVLDGAPAASSPGGGPESSPPEAEAQPRSGAETERAPAPSDQRKANPFEE
jgi:uncharacterized protein (TIGR02266 family)